jgi:hypothetical protein
MEMVKEYVFLFYTRKAPLPFPEYLQSHNRYLNDFWITQEGECIYPSQMGSRHLVNTVRLMHRADEDLEDDYAYCYADERILYGLAPRGIFSTEASKQPNDRTYRELWKRRRIYMLLRREVKLRNLEEYL